MVKQQNGLVQWTRYVPEVACAIALVLATFQPAVSATKPDGTLEITNGKEKFMRMLESMAYTSSGTGPVLYALECSACPFSQAFESDWKGQLDGVEMRRIPIAVNETTANESAYLAQTRDINDFYAFMSHTKVAPPIRACNCPEDNKAIQAVGRMLGPWQQVLRPIIIKNGWPNDSPAPPQFIWETNGRAYVGRYSKETVREILRILPSGTQTKEASAPPMHSPASEPVSTRSDASPAETTAQLMTAEKNSPKSGGDAPASNSGSTSIGSGGSGPDVLGFRIGMHPNEVRAIIKSRHLAEVSWPQGYVEDKKELSYLYDGKLNKVPNGEFVSSIRMQGMEGSIDIRFSAVPGNEEVLDLSRKTSFQENKKPTHDAFEKALVEKYGTPTYADPTRPSIIRNYVWAYDRDGTLRKPGASFRLILNGTETPGACANSEAGNVNYGLDLLEQFATGCGAIYLRVQVTFADIYTGRNTIVQSYATNIVGHDAGVRTVKASKAIVDTALAAASGAKVKEAQQQKPNL